MPQTIRLIFKTILVTMFFYTLVNAQNTEEYVNYQTVKKSEIKKYALKKGVYDRSFTLTNGKKWNYQISIPTIKEGKKLPLVLALHWAGGGNTYKEYSNCLAFPALDFLNAIIIAPSAKGGLWVEPMNEEKVIALMKDIKKHWPIEDSKIIVTGYSNGGIGSWYYAKKYPKLFSAAIPMAGYYNTQKLKIPLYIIHGEMDELFDVNKVREDVHGSVALGGKIKYEELPGLSHYDACSYVGALKRVAALVQEEVWKP